MSTQPPPARPWLLRLGSQVRNIDPPPTQPQTPPPSRGPPFRQASLALGRTTALAQPAPLFQAPPPQSPVPLSGPAPATANGNGPTITPVAEAAPKLPPPRAPAPVAPTLTRSLTPLQSPKVVANPSPTSSFSAPKPEPKPNPVQTPPSAPVPVALALTRSLAPPQSPKVVANPSLSSSFSASKPEPRPNPISPAAAGNGSPEKNGTKGVLGGGAGEPLKTNRNDSFNKRSQDAKAPSSASPKSEDKKNPAKSEARAVSFTGRNVGAFMDLGAAYGHQTEKKQQLQLFYNVRGQPETEVKKTDVGETYDYYTDTESEVNDGKQQKPFFSLVNSNVQSVNNSLLLGAACVQGSPGVYVNLGRSSRPRKNGDDGSTGQKRPPSLR